jgi:hypothetical protein
MLYFRDGKRSVKFRADSGCACPMCGGSGEHEDHGYPPETTHPRWFKALLQEAECYFNRR